MNNSRVEMRDGFFDSLYEFAFSDERIMVLSDDFGAPSLDKYREHLVKRYLNLGISEQNMISVAAGLALSGKRPYVYGISPFVTLRCFEQVKLDICVMNLPVTVVGVGAGFGYSTAGPTHHAIEDIAIMRTLPNITIVSPSDSLMAAQCAEFSLASDGPLYLRLDRGNTPLLNENIQIDFTRGHSVHAYGNDIAIIATGTMVARADEVACKLKQKKGIACRVIDLFKLKPIDSDALLASISGVNGVVTIEEHVFAGGLGSIIAELLAEQGAGKMLLRLAVRDESCITYGTRGDSQSLCRLDEASVFSDIVEKFKL